MNAQSIQDNYIEYINLIRKRTKHTQTHPKMSKTNRNLHK